MQNLSQGRVCVHSWCGHGAAIGVMAKVSSLIEVLPLGGCYELDYLLWAQFTLSAVRVNVDVTWSRDKVLVSSYTLLRIFYVACVHPIC